HHQSGHMYFVLKDENAQIRCVMWRGRNRSLRFLPADGMKVLVFGSVVVYEPRGEYQVNVEQIVPAGLGELQLAFEQLKRRLREEGLFDSRYKKPIPRYPERIGIVTSETGAAIRDLVSVIWRRYPPVELILYPVRVQGEGAAEEIAAAIDAFNEYGEVDVLIVGRGGGSLEDLWAFNEEIVARAIFRSRIPVVSAVGHEVDFSIADFVADLRAPTPSAAAEMVVRDRNELLRHIETLISKSARHLERQLHAARQRLDAVLSSYGLRPSDLVLQQRQRLDELDRRLESEMAHRLKMLRQRFSGVRQHLESLSPEATLRRGYSITVDEDTGQLVREAGALEPGRRVAVQFWRGRTGARVEEIEPEATWRSLKLGGRRSGHEDAD
ncbi:MAG: exodeoxyribonuclease VII large subunit, partial [Calditrichaeota bacterium]|nr:exodeoxyribonuclease VII large subunit [Calditrichota bacterium]